MCGRYSLGLSHEEIQELHRYNVQIGEWVGRDNFVPRHNVAPRSQAPVIRRREANEVPAAGPSHQNAEPSVLVAHAAPVALSAPCTDALPNISDEKPELADRSAGSAVDSTPLILQTMKWGLVPHFSRHEDSSLKTINARCEALIEGNTGIWASIKGKRRCAAVCEGYYEWLKKGKERLPHFTKHKDGRPMLLAGLWDCTVLEGSTKPMWTFTIVTTDACTELSWLHDRQPVILPDEAALAVWLDTSAGKWTPELSKLCAPYHAAAEHPLVCYQVPKEVGKIGTESPTFIQPVQERKDGIQALFAQQKVAGVPPAATTSTRAIRKRSPSSVGLESEGGPSLEDRPAKKAKVEKVDAWEDDSDIECIDDPRLSTPGRDNGETTKVSVHQNGAYALGPLIHSVACVARWHCRWWRWYLF
ncbi:hypothetical protein C8Q79DRAFT_897700 [Trametes meyenii]|nr:hypothetical protein C8Q79DRAFT_897700 [Trametes meyenii]